MLRVRDNSTVSFGDCIVTESVGGVQQPAQTLTYSVTSDDLMTDVVTPNYKAKQRRGEVVISSMSKIKWQRIMHQGSRILTTPTIVHSVSGVCWLVHEDYIRRWRPDTCPAILDEIERQAALVITDAYAKVGSPDVAVLTELAELRETLSFLYSPVKGMVNLTRKLRDYSVLTKRLELKHSARVEKWNKLPPRIQAKRKAPEPLKLPKLRLGKFEATDISSAWLAYRYAIMPLLYTFQDIQALLKKRAEGPKTRATARATGSGTVDLNSELSRGDKRHHELTWTEVISRTGTATVTTRAGVLYVPDFSLSAQLGVQWNRVPAALYEGIPLSFVADWAYNGSALYDALTAELRAQKILGAWVSTTTEFSVSWNLEVTPVSGGSASGWGTVLTTTGKWVTRRTASLSDVQLKFRLEMNGKRVADGLALIHTMLATAIKRRK